MALKLLKAGDVTTVPLQGTPVARGMLVRSTGALIAALNDYPAGFIMDDASTNTPSLTVDVYGNGSIIEDTSLSLAVTDVVYSAGDGTYTTTEPAGAAGTRIYEVGYPLSATSFVVRITNIEKGA